MHMFPNACAGRMPFQLPACRGLLNLNCIVRQYFDFLNAKEFE